MSIRIITDSTSYIPQSVCKENNISVISLNVIMNGKSSREIDLKNEEFYDEMDKLPELPTSSQPSIDEAYQEFKKLASEGHDIIGIFISSDMSGTYSSMNLVKGMILEEYPNINIQIVDSRTNCMQMGYIVLEAARTASEGKSFEEVLKVIDYTISHSKFLFVPDTLKYLKRGGRIGGASALLGSILQIRPILTVEDGKTTVFEKVRTKKKAVDTIVNKVVSEVTQKGLGEVAVHHINAEQEAKEIADRLTSVLNSEIAIISIGAIIGLHVGPGSIGVVYHTR